MDALTLSPLTVGRRVKHARDVLGLTQEAVSSALGFKDRQTLSDIENGKRAVRADELLKFSDVLDRDVEFFIDPFSVVGEAQYSWRASPSLPGEELDRFEATADGWVGLLRWLRAQDATEHSPLGFTLRLDLNSTFEAAQQAAELLVRKHQLGRTPASKLVEFIEQDLDIPVLFVDTGLSSPRGYISGAACHLPEMGVILVNRREGVARRNFDLAHELFHTLTWERMKPEHRESNSVEERQRTRRAEQLADNFAAALLMPRASLDEFLGEGRATDVGRLVQAAEQLQVSAEALGWRLRALGRIDEPTRLELAQYRRVDTNETLPKLFSRDFVAQLHVALDKGRLSARKAAKTLGLSLHELTEVFEAYRLPSPFAL